MNMDFILVPVVVGIIFYTIYRIFDLFVRRKERQNLIDKLDPNTLGDPTSLLNGASNSRSSNTLKFGCLLVGVGLGLLIGFLVSLSSIDELRANFEPYNVLKVQSIIYGSCVLLFGGIGLIAAFIIERRCNR